LGVIRRTRRYRCANQACGWEGNVFREVNPFWRFVVSAAILGGGAMIAAYVSIRVADYILRPTEFQSNEYGS
jgi:hypothetical protein